MAAGLWMIVLLFAIQLVFSGCKEAAVETAVSADASVSEDALASADAKDPLDIYEGQCEMILESDVWNGYEPSQDFLDWVADTYGNGAMKQIACYVEVPGTDASGDAMTDIWEIATGATLHALQSLYLEAADPEAEELNHIIFKDCASSDETVFDFTGDVGMSEGTPITNYLESRSNGIYDCLSSDLMDELNQADVLMINNEFTFSTRGTATEGKPWTFRANPAHVDVLQEMGVDIANLANNHAYDYGPDALLDTMDTLKNVGIPYVGAGANLEEAMEPLYVVANGRKIAIVSATQVERSTNQTKEATANQSGVLKTLNPDKFIQVIETAEENSDLTIVYVHWGLEGQSYFEADQVALAEAYVEAGADVIIGGHTHCLQGISYVEDVPVFYSLGNFWFNSKTMDNGIAQVVIGKDRMITTRFLPCIQSGCTTKLITNESEKQQHLESIEALSEGITLDDQGTVSKTTQE